MQLLFQGKVEVVEEYEQEIHTVQLTIKLPAVLRLLRYVPISNKKQIIRFSRVNIFIRDNYTCQYCGNRFNKTQLTLDHVIPIVQGGKKSWDNIVTACKTCNQRKGGCTPAQANMQLIRKPKKPNWLPSANIQLGISVTPERWKIYLKLEKGYSPDDSDGSPGFGDPGSGPAPK